MRVYVYRDECMHVYMSALRLYCVKKKNIKKPIENRIYYSQKTQNIHTFFLFLFAGTIHIVSFGMNHTRSFCSGNIYALLAL